MTAFARVIGYPTAPQEETGPLHPALCSAAPPEQRSVYTEAAPSPVIRGMQVRVKPGIHSAGRSSLLLFTLQQGWNLSRHIHLCSVLKLAEEGLLPGHTKTRQAQSTPCGSGTPGGYCGFFHAYLHWIGQQHDLGDGCWWLDGTKWRKFCPRGWLQLHFH